MEEELKKEIFILILSHLFDDKTKEINKDNCISFYHFLVDTLKEEIKAIPEEEDADISLCHSITELLCNFDRMNQEIWDWKSETINEYLIDYSGLSKEEFKESISKFRKIYILIKDDFFLGLI